MYLQNLLIWGRKLRTARSPVCIMRTEASDASQMEHFTAMIWQTNRFLPIQPEKVPLADRYVIAAMVKKQVISGVFTMKKPAWEV